MCNICTVQQNTHLRLAPDTTSDQSIAKRDRHILTHTQTHQHANTARAGSQRAPAPHAVAYDVRQRFALYKFRFACSQTATTSSSFRRRALLECVFECVVCIIIICVGERETECFEFYNDARINSQRQPPPRLCCSVLTHFVHIMYM